MATVRIQRLANLIKARIATLLIRDAHDPRLTLITITKVDLAKDMVTCKVYWSTLNEGGKRTAVEHALKDATPFLSREVAAILSTRISPRLAFVFDKTVEGMERVSALINGALQEDEGRARDRGDDLIDEPLEDGSADTPYPEADTPYPAADTPYPNAGTGDSDEGTSQTDGDSKLDPEGS